MGLFLMKVYLIERGVHIGDKRIRYIHSTLREREVSIGDKHTTLLLYVYTVHQKIYTNTKSYSSYQVPHLV